MAADEVVEQEGKKEEPSSPAISKKGWIIVIAVVVLEAVFFGLLLYLDKTDPKKNKSEAASIAQKVSSDFLNKYKVTYKDLNYSIMTTSANMATLSMNMEIILGPTKDEIERSEYPTDENMMKFRGAVVALEPDIMDFLQSIIGSMSIQQLLKPDGQEHIKQQVRSYVNERLEQLKFAEVGDEIDRRRITDVKITQFILQR